MEQVLIGYLLTLYYDEVKFQIVSIVDPEKETLSYVMTTGKTKIGILTPYTTTRMHILATIVVLNKPCVYADLRTVELPYYTLIFHT